jgi:putative colanic acid biosynthesis UDP-glucose lipid carrier transferase
MNVLRGELSLVGPRPHAVCHNDLYAASLATYTNRHKVKPGITGWAQVHGCRGATESADAMRKRLDLDLFYINQWSLWLDIKILARTLAIPFYDNNAY